MKKYSQFERICGCNCSFVMEKGSFVEWMAATGSKFYIFENRVDYKSVFQRKTVPLRILGPCKWLPEIMAVPLKCMAACSPLKLQYALNRNICQIHCIYTIMAASAVKK